MKNRFVWITSKQPPQERKAADQAQLEKDRATFAAACREIGTIGDNEANFNVVRSTLGPGFISYQVQQAVASGAVHLSPASAAEQQAWQAEAAQRRVDFLQNKASIPELRRIANQESTAVSCSSSRPGPGGESCS